MASRLNQLGQRCTATCPHCGQQCTQVCRSRSGQHFGRHKTAAPAGKSRGHDWKNDRALPHSPECDCVRCRMAAKIEVVENAVANVGTDFGNRDDDDDLPPLRPAPAQRKPAPPASNSLLTIPQAAEMIGMSAKWLAYHYDNFPQCTDPWWSRSEASSSIQKVGPGAVDSESHV